MKDFVCLDLLFFFLLRLLVVGLLMKSEKVILKYSTLSIHKK